MRTKAYVGFLLLGWGAVVGILSDIDHALWGTRALHFPLMVVVWVIAGCWAGLGVYFALLHRREYASLVIPSRLGLIHRLRERMFEWRIYNEP
jgi:hypothetical protein